MGTDKEPFPYKDYYENDDKIKEIKEKFPPIKQDLLGGAPTKSAGMLEDLHVFELSNLSKYYTNK